MNPRTLCWIACGLMGCSASDLGGECATEDDCPSGGFCLFEASRGTTFCSQECQGDLDCDPTEFCGGVVLEPNASDQSAERALCRPLVQQCRDQEICNDLDDDCDGTIDEDCVVQTCQFDQLCAPFSCIPGPAGPQAGGSPECQPRVSRDRSFFRTCSDGSECPNGICNTGFCSPLCAPVSGDETAQCPDAVSLETSPGVDETLPLVCANQVLEGDIVRHDACQVPCRSGADCPFGTSCVWRTVGLSRTLHESVCAEPPSDRSPLGASCPNNFVEGDATCGSGLCFGLVCTRFCAGSSDDCSDVGPDFVCEPRELVYSDQSGTLRFMDLRICVASE